jgi:hypothetical protein
VEYSKRAQMLLLVYARRFFKPNIRAVQKSAENTGFLHVFPNKGGLSISLTLFGTSFTFVSCHLTPHEGVRNCYMRNESAAEILGGIRMGDRRFDPSILSHHTFWMGDLNYRTTFNKSNPSDLDITEQKSKSEEDMNDDEDDVKYDVAGDRLI